MEAFEYVVVGGGSAGMALAARLSAAKRKTLLVEAERKKGNLLNFWHVNCPPPMAMPSSSRRSTGNTRANPSRI